MQAQLLPKRILKSLKSSSTSKEETVGEETAIERELENINVSRNIKFCFSTTEPGVYYTPPSCRC